MRKSNSFPSLYALRGYLPNRKEIRLQRRIIVVNDLRIFLDLQNATVLFVYRGGHASLLDMWSQKDVAKRFMNEAVLHSLILLTTSGPGGKDASFV